MPYPSDVTQARMGAEAFAENDAVSQLAQAAFVLLLGRELARNRGGLMIPPRGAPQESTDEDEARFALPHIAGEGRRYRFADALADGIRRRMPRDATRLHQLSRELAYRLQEAPTERTAAALLHVCALRPDPVVRVAGAAAAFELTAEPGRVIATLARSTRDSDLLVSALAATALARIDPRHPALSRLARRGRRARGSGRAHTSLLVHGTFARNETWWQPGGDFHDYLRANVLPDLYSEADRFEWSGGYSDAARALAERRHLPEVLTLLGDVGDASTQADLERFVSECDQSIAGAARDALRVLARRTGHSQPSSS